MVDEEVISARLQSLEESLKELKQIAAQSEEDFLSSWQNRRLAERCVQIAAQTCLDIGNHLVAAKALRAPKGYADVFQILGEAGVLSSDLARDMKRLAGLRNILVHDYLEVDYEQLYQLIQDTSRLAEFARAIKGDVWKQGENG